MSPKRFLSKAVFVKEDMQLIHLSIDLLDSTAQHIDQGSLGERKVQKMPFALNANKSEIVMRNQAPYKCSMKIDHNEK